MADRLAHSVRPETYREINNFYTATIYEKGAEIIRMYRTLVGPDAFDRGMALYFERFDGTAATVEDFLGCFAESSGRDLTQFFRWYVQAGTPRIEAAWQHEASTRRLTLELAQTAAATPGQPEKLPFVVPLAFGLVAPDGHQAMVTTPNEGLSEAERRNGIIELSTANRRIVFEDVAAGTIPSLLRGFSAPVKLSTNASDADLLTLMTFDSDPFNRWEAAQTVLTRLMMAWVNGAEASADFLKPALSAVIAAGAKDPAFAAQVLNFPGESDLARDIGHDVDPDAIHGAREKLRGAMGLMLAADLRVVYDVGRDRQPYSPDARGAGRRALRNTALSLLAAGDPGLGATLAHAQFETADNMTDRLAALAVLTLIPGDAREQALHVFYEMFKAEALVIDKWFALQAAIPEEGTVERVLRLMSHSAFSMAVPNRIYALIGVFSANPTQFNRLDGKGFDLVSDIVLALDGKNPQVAARILNAFRSWRLLEPGRRAEAERNLRRIVTQPSLSPDVKDIVTRSLG